jgi:putative transcriptional regulator
MNRSENMPKKSKFKKPSMLEVAHEMAKGLYQIKAIDAVTMGEYDELCLPSVKELTPKKIKKSDSMKR